MSGFIKPVSIGLKSVEIFISSAAQILLIKDIRCFLPKIAFSNNVLLEEVKQLTMWTMMCF